MGGGLVRGRSKEPQGSGVSRGGVVWGQGLQRRNRRTQHPPAGLHGRQAADGFPRLGMDASPVAAEGARWAPSPSSMCPGALPLRPERCCDPSFHGATQRGSAPGRGARPAGRSTGDRRSTLVGRPYGDGSPHPPACWEGHLRKPEGHGTPAVRLRQDQSTESGDQRWWGEGSSRPLPRRAEETGCPCILLGTGNAPSKQPSPAASR